MNGGCIMYIPDFWCGAATTIAVEIATLIAIAIWQGRGGKK